MNFLLHKMRGNSGLAESLLAPQEAEKTDFICHIIGELR
jgi:hypothetical protein